MALIPGISSSEIDEFLEERNDRPIEDFADFRKRGKLRAETLAHVEHLNLDD